ncbi:hypothetical protein V2H45_08375 [Tumidithrix elongata RA019]|uniref:Uncharacterized protein n=2 Tax=Tumidithrix TaxID=3088355 RepID=A0AAW9PYS9_9CYAN|nr:hypothetical protein [Tumidithrix elongata RA019]
MMSEKIDSFANIFRGKLNDIDDRLSSVKATIESAAEETQSTIESKLNEVKAKLEKKKDEFATYRTKLAELAAEKQAEVKSKVEEWKTKQEFEELNRRADRAEHYAASGIIVAMATIDEAEEAILEAIAARLDADNAVKVK